MTGLSSIGGASIGAIASASSSGGSRAIPISDIGRGAWTSSLGASLFEAINESSYSDSDSVSSSLNPADDAFLVLLQELDDPGVSYGHVLKYRFRKVGSGIANITVKLKQASTLIATFSHSDVSTSYTLAEQTLSASEANSITDYSDLRVEITADKA